ERDVRLAIAFLGERAQRSHGFIGFTTRKLVENLVADIQPTQIAKHGDPLQHLLELRFIRGRDGDRRGFGGRVRRYSLSWLLDRVGRALHEEQRREDGAAYDSVRAAIHMNSCLPADWFTECPESDRTGSEPWH